MNIWMLPGPRHFMAALTSKIRSGHNVVLRLPLHAPDNIEWGVREHFAAEWGWETLEVTPDVKPVDLLFKRFWPEAPLETLRSAVSFAESEIFNGRIIWLDGLNDSTWIAWRNFLDDYKNACRAVAEFRRTLFIAPVVGKLANSLPGEDATLTHVTWDEVVSEYDILILAATKLYERGFKSTKLDLLAATISKIALWDVSLANILMNASINSILDPLDILRELSISRSWDDQTPLSWEQGTLGNISGRKLEHSAYFYVTRKNRFLNHRIWAAQASVLLPIIEQKRLSLLPKIRHYLDLPFDTGYATISDPNDLEIGYLFYQLNRNGADPAIRQTVRRLKEVRNALSHLEPLSVSELLDDNLYDPTV